MADRPLRVVRADDHAVVRSGLKLLLAQAGRDDPRIAEQLAAVQRDATRNRIDSTPSFLVGRRGGRLVRLRYTELAPAQFRDVLDRELAGAG